MSKSRNDQPFLAFAHIEKAAGTTFIHILRHNYFMRYLDVRPFHIQSGDMFTAADMKIALHLNPFLKCIGGHAVNALSNLHKVIPNIQYIILLRDPVERYLSHYEYWVEKLGKRLSFDDFLQSERARNFQTKKIAGKEDADLAIRILIDSYFLVGAVERFDEFLVLLRKKLEPFKFHPGYRRRNVARYNGRAEQLREKYKDRIRANNELDLQLYDFFRKEIHSKLVKEYGQYFNEDASKAKMVSASQQPRIGRRYVDYVCRKLYYEPVTGMLRKAHGLPIKGSYGYR